MIPEGVRVAHVAAQGVDRLVPAHVHYLEQRGAAGGRGREEAGAEAVPSSSKGTSLAVTRVRWKPYLAGGWKP